MLQEPFDIRFQDSIIYWDFTLKDQNDPKMDYTQIPEHKRTLAHLLHDINYQLQLKLQEPEKKPTTHDRAKRKLVKKILKRRKTMLSEFAKEIEIPKHTLRNYFEKKEVEAGERDEIGQRFKEWLEVNLVRNLVTQTHLPREETFALSKQFIKSYFKQSDLVQSKFIDDIYLIYMDKFIPSSKELATESSDLIEIDLNLSVEDRAITDSFLWSPERVHEIDIWMYTKYLLNDLLMEYDINVTKEQFETLHEETRVQLRTQLEYKTLLNKYKPLLVSFAAMETAEIKEYVIPIEVRVMDNDGNLIYSDDFEWDILNEANNVEQFCQILIQDEGIPQEYLSEISEQIRTQIYNELNWRFICLSNTFKSLLKERELPKLKNQATGQIKKNIIFALDMPLPINPDSKLSGKVDFHNSQMYNLLSKNYDLLPKEYQKMMNIEVEQGKSYNEVMDGKTKNSLKSLPFKLEGNPYLPSNLISQFDAVKVKNLYNDLVEEAKRS